VHDLDPSRRRGPFVVVDCTTLSPELSGSELFGHAKGAFTHAVTARDGAVALADCGTLFLDEIGELELPLQARLLRMYKRVGEDTWRRSDFRLTCATNRDLEAEVEAGRFRCDLYFRISQWTVRAPSLSERREDIPLLVRHFLSEHDDAPRIMPEVMEQLMCRDYPGNVRELRNVVLRMAERQRGFGVLSTGSLDRPSIPAAADTLAAWTQMLALAVEGALDAGLGLKHIGQIAETIAVQAAERRTGSTNRAAELLQVTPRALQLRRQVRPDGGSA
jgi:transcriptional regulator with GAF, ATPase, and Fis domain